MTTATPSSPIIDPDRCHVAKNKNRVCTTALLGSGKEVQFDGNDKTGHPEKPGVCVEKVNNKEYDG